jgi:molecular chaperone HscB
VADGEVCSACGKVQPVTPGTTLFDVLGLPRGVDVDKAELERAYRERSLRLHPDRAGKDDARERRLAVERTALLNEAYKTLRAPERRAFYLLKLHGLDLLKEEARAVSVPPPVLEEVLDLREQLHAARTAGDEELVSTLSDRVRVQSAATLSAAQSALRRLERNPSDEVARVEAAEALARLRYHHRFLEAAEASDEEES